MAVKMVPSNTMVLLNERLASDVPILCAFTKSSPMKEAMRGTAIHGIIGVMYGRKKRSQNASAYGLLRSAGVIVRKSIPAAVIPPPVYDAAAPVTFTPVM